MARRVFLHIGPPKTGTSFLQTAWWQHRRELAEQGLLYPGEQKMAHFRAAAVVLDKARVTERMSPERLQMWDRLTEDVAAWDGDAIISDEHFAPASRAKARTVLDRLAEVADEVHVMVTARDLARQVPAAWQQSVKQGSDRTFEEYWQDLASHPRRGFWRLQHLPTVLNRWSQGVAPSRVHLVVHAPAGAPRSLLWERTCELLGVNAAVLGPVSRTNESLGAGHVEVLRRMNAALPPDRSRIDFGRLTKTFFSQEILLPAGHSDRITLPPDIHAQVVARSVRMVGVLRSRSYDVIGDLDDLLPDEEPGPGRRPEQVAESEVAELASAALARFLQHEMSRRRRTQRLARENRRLRRLQAEAPEDEQRGALHLLRRIGRGG